MLFENVVIRHTLILILPTSQTQLWDRDLLFTRILFIVQIESGHPENIAFNGRGSCPQTCPETVAQKRRPKHHNGRKNLVNGRLKKRRLKCFVFQGPLDNGHGNGHGNGHDNGHGNGHAMCSLFWGGPPLGGACGSGILAGGFMFYPLQEFDSSSLHGGGICSNQNATLFHGRSLNQCAGFTHSVLLAMESQSKRGTKLRNNPRSL